MPTQERLYVLPGGTVVSDKAIEIGPEWRSFKNSGVSLSRVGMPTSLAETRSGTFHKNWKGEQGFYWRNDL